MGKKKVSGIKVIITFLLTIFSISLLSLCFAEEPLIKWETFRNEKFGYEVKYPKEYIPVNKTTSLYSVLFESAEIKNFDDGRKRPYYMFSISARPVNIGLNEFVEKEVDLFNKGGFSNLEAKDAIIDGIPAKELISITDASGSVIFSQAYLLKDGNMYCIRVSTIKNDTKFTNKIFNLILSSFKFVNNNK